MLWHSPIAKYTVGKKKNNAVSRREYRECEEAHKMLNCFETLGGLWHERNTLFLPWIYFGDTISARNTGCNTNAITKCQHKLGIARVRSMALMTMTSLNMTDSWLK